MNITPDLMQTHPDYLMDVPGAPVPPAAQFTRAERLFGVPVLVVTVTAVPVYLAAQAARAVLGW